MKNLSIGKKVSIVVSFIAIISLIFGFIILGIYAQHGKEEVYNDIVKDLQESMNSKLHGKKNIGISNAVSIANDGRIKRALRENDRERAIVSLASVNTSMKERTDFKNIQVHIHTKENRSFVRSWNSKKFGDDLTAFRNSIVSVNKNKKEVNTFEIGKAGLSLRSLVPIIDDNGKHLGSLEFIQGLNSVAKSFDKTGNGFLLLMDKKASDTKIAGELKEYKGYIISQKFINQKFFTDASNIDIAKLLKEKIIFTNQYLYTYIDIKDFQGKKLGIAIASAPMRKVNIAIDNAQQLIDISMGIMGVLILFILATTIILLRKVVIHPITNFQSGLLHFFEYLNRESKEVKPLNVIANDEIGSMSKVVNENIQKTKTLIEEDNALIEDVKRVVEGVNKGIFKQKIIKSTSNESLEELKVNFNHMLEEITKHVCEDINKVNKVLESYASLNFTDKIENDNGAMVQGLNNLARIINDMLVENKSNGLTLGESSNILLKNVDTLNSASNEAAASLEETAAALEEMTSTITSNTENVIKMAEVASKVTDSTHEGQKLANDTTTAMDEINKEVSDINEAIKIIDQIAFQTNILSLNAAVEAATAGEAGKGFAVVAGEVRNLAARSAEAANDIKTLVENATIKANNGKTIADKMIKGYSGLSENIAQTIELIKDIEGASKEQQTGIAQINDAVTELDQQTQQNAMVANQTNDIALQTDKIAKLIVSNADEKEFIGKDTVKAKQSNEIDSLKVA